MTRVDVSSLFLQRHVTNRHLHSFPTRRSSDLRLKVQKSPLAASPSPPRPQSGEDGSSMHPPTLTAAPTVVPALDVCDPIDRKSTRLNSSHVSISYAVFCLKKKKKTI